MAVQANRKRQEIQTVAVVNQTQTGRTTATVGVSGAGVVYAANQVMCTRHAGVFSGCERGGKELKVSMVAGSGAMAVR